jgi:hypothetical protein
MTSVSLALGANLEGPEPDPAAQPGADRLEAVARSAALAPPAGDLASLASLAAEQPAPHLV